MGRSLWLEVPLWFPWMIRLVCYIRLSHQVGMLERALSHASTGVQKVKARLGSISRLSRISSGSSEARRAQSAKVGRRLRRTWAIIIDRSNGEYELEDWRNAFSSSGMPRSL